MKITILIAVVFFHAQSFSQVIAELKLDNKQSILNGKAYFQFPADAQNIARSADIMSADPNINKETRIMMDIGKQRLVFFARELFSSSNKDSFYETIHNDVKHAFDTKLLVDRDSVLAILSTPRSFDTTLTGIIINNLIVRVQDGTIFSIGAYINPEGFVNKNEYQKLSEKVFNSLAKGERRVNYKARTETYPVMEGKKTLAISLPEGYVINRDAKYDFEVLHFQKIRDLADTNWQNLTLYLGHHPSPFYKENQLSPEQAEKVKGSFLNKEVEWLYFKLPADPFYLKEQIIAADDIEKDLIVHIAMMSGNTKAIDEMSAIVNNIKLVVK